MNNIDDLNEEKILNIFISNGMIIEVGANFSAKGQSASLLNSANEIINMCSNAVENQCKPSKYEWVKGSLWGSLTKCASSQILRLWRK